MIQGIEERYSPAVLAKVAERLGLAVEELKELGGFESYVYEFEQDGNAYILKVTHSLRRSVEYLRGELEWVNWLADRGVPVARGERIEVIPHEDGTEFLAIIYAKAPGAMIGEADWDSLLFEKWGRLLGQMHRHSKTYEVSNPAWKRQSWQDEQQLRWDLYVPADQTLVYERAQALLSRLRSLPVDRDGYGLVHTDLTYTNFLVQDGELTAFDFDDCQYHWFLYDIAVILYAALWFPKRPYADKAEFAAEFLTSFMRGYRMENRLDPAWFKHLKDFLLLRQLMMYVIAHQAFDLNHLEDWQVEMFANAKHNIEHEVPLVELKEVF